MKTEIISLGDKRAGVMFDSQCFYSCFVDEGKDFLIVGAKASGEQLYRASKKLGLKLDDLIEFRDSLTKL